MHINPRSETGTDDFDIWGLSKVHIDDNENIYVSGGVQVSDEINPKSQTKSVGITISYRVLGLVLLG